MSCNRPIHYTSPAWLMRGLALVGKSTAVPARRERCLLWHFRRFHVHNRAAYVSPEHVHAKIDNRPSASADGPWHGQRR